MKASEWNKKGRYITVNEYQHFVYVSDNDKPYLLILHGYPTSSYDYYKVLEELEKYYCVVIHDHLGFGFSDKPEQYSYSLMEQTDQALLVWRALGIKSAAVLAHDYGTSVATELLARLNSFGELPVHIEQLVLCNGSMHVELAQLRIIQKLLLNRFSGPIIAKLSSRKTLFKNLKNIYFDQDKVSEQEVDAVWEMMTWNGGRKVLPQTTQYIKQRYTYWQRWIGALKNTKLAVHIVWAENDPVAVIEMADVLYDEIQDCSLSIIPESGHFPMLETPNKWAKAVISSLNVSL